ncbi:uncharacterized protein EI97DRAFT_115035 [Westerdykella ornata]|uniref:Uncharacterized protein n=1 Tax=Westerdykella ornata TaxID=318751 RepID=A0A6A6JUG8_WESOR|nr:uncharacterized protein EI97DRAFT_115035 [Westerdykella ornata]KAF2280222.1 hypothetical protein EI97DRAFT_115035 [Westerdykella ornata]
MAPSDSATPLVARCGGMKGRTGSAKSTRKHAPKGMDRTSISGAGPMTSSDTGLTQPLPMTADSNTLTNRIGGRPKRQSHVRDDVPAGPGQQKSPAKTKAQGNDYARNRLLIDFEEAAFQGGLAESERAMSILKDVLMYYNVSVKADAPSMPHVIAPTAAVAEAADQDLPSSDMEPASNELFHEFCTYPSDSDTDPSSQPDDNDGVITAYVAVNKDRPVSVDDRVDEDCAAAPPDESKTKDVAPTTIAAGDSDVTTKALKCLCRARVASARSALAVDRPSTVFAPAPALPTPTVPAHHASQLGPRTQVSTGKAPFFTVPRNLTDSFYRPSDVLVDHLRGASTEPQADTQRPIGKPSFFGPPRNLNDSFYCPDDDLDMHMQALESKKRAQPAAINPILTTGVEPSYTRVPQGVTNSLRYRPNAMTAHTQVSASSKAMLPTMASNLLQSTRKAPYFTVPRNVNDSFYCPPDVMGDYLKSSGSQTPAPTPLANPLLRNGAQFGVATGSGNRVTLSSGTRYRMLVNQQGASISPASGFEANMGPVSRAAPMEANSLAPYHLPSLDVYGDATLRLPLPNDVDPQYPAELQVLIGRLRVQGRWCLEKIRLVTLQVGQAKGESLDEMVEAHKRRGRRYVKSVREAEDKLIKGYLEARSKPVSQASQPTGGYTTASPLGKRGRSSTSAADDDVQRGEARPIKRPRDEATEPVDGFLTTPALGKRDRASSPADDRDEPPKEPRPIKRPRQRKN